MTKHPFNRAERLRLKRRKYDETKEQEARTSKVRKRLIQTVEEREKEDELRAALSGSLQGQL